MRIMRTALTAAAAAFTLATPGTGVKGQQCDYAGGSAPTYYDSCSCSACGGSGGGCGYCWTDAQSCYTDGDYCEPVGGWRPAE